MLSVQDASRPWLGVAVVTYGAAEFIVACLESLVASGYPRLRIVVVDNDSPDDTAGAVRRWALGETSFSAPEPWPLDPRPPVEKPLDFEERPPGARPRPPQSTVTLIHAGGNYGFAAGVNIALRSLRAAPEIGLFWVLNPDTVVAPDTPDRFALHAKGLGRFALIGGRIVYLDRPDTIQVDGGGRFRFRIGFAASVNLGQPASSTALPDPGALDYISGANMLASRAFLDRAGLMDEGWFLYHEEIDWCFRRGDLPLGLAPGTLVYHRAGATIGSGGGQVVASPLAAYFQFRNHLRFTARWAPHWLPCAYLAGLAMIVHRFARARAWPQILAALRGLHRLGPPTPVRAQLSPEVWARIGEDA